MKALLKKEQNPGLCLEDVCELEAVITDTNDYRLELAKKMGAPLANHVTRCSLRDVQSPIGMKAGFAASLEMSGNASVFHGSDEQRSRQA